MLLTEEEIEAIAERVSEKVAEKAADRALEKLTGRLYQEVGKGVVSKFFYIVGACAVGLWLWLKAKNLI